MSKCRTIETMRAAYEERIVDLKEKLNTLSRSVETPVKDAEISESEAADPDFCGAQVPMIIDQAFAHARPSLVINVEPMRAELKEFTSEIWHAECVLEAVEIERLLLVIRSIWKQLQSI